MVMRSTRDSSESSKLHVYTFALRLPHSFLHNLANSQSMSELVVCVRREVHRVQIH